MKRIEKFQKMMREKNGSPVKVENELAEISTDLSVELDTNPEYSLEVDPTNKYGFNELQKQFIRYYIKYKNIPLAASLACIDNEMATQIFSMYEVEQEIRRISRALYLRQFKHKMLTIDQISGWLSSLITDEFVPDADRLKTTDKLRVAQMLIDLNDFKRNAYADPNAVMTLNIEDQLKEISVDAIKRLIYSTSKDSDDKDKVIDEIRLKKTLTVEEVAYLKTLPTKDLLNVVDTAKTLVDAS